MKTWKTANRRMGCGFDMTHSIAKGEGYLEIDGGGRTLVRCSTCAVRHETHDATEPPAEEIAEPVLLEEPEPDPEPEPALETEGDPW